MYLKLSLSFLFLMLCPLSWAGGSSSQKLQNVQHQIDTLSKDLGHNKASKETLYKQLKQQSRRVSSLTRGLRKLKQKINKKNHEIVILSQQQGLKKQQQQQQLKVLYTQIRSAFISAQPSYLKILLNQQDPATLARSTVYYQYFHRQRQQQLSQLDTSLHQLSDQQKQLYASQKALQLLFEKQQQKQTKLQQETKQRRHTMALLDRKINSQGSRLSTLQRQQLHLQKLVESLAKPAKKVHSARPLKQSGSFARLRGALTWPVKGKLLAHYGSPRNLGKLTWQGIMVSSATGTEVRATASGRVVFADWLRGFGLLVIIDHGHQYMSLYGNNETLLKQRGDTVAAGEVIAQTGAQGVRQIAGLYFEIRHKGSPTNPLKWLRKRS